MITFTDAERAFADSRRGIGRSLMPEINSNSHRPTRAPMLARGPMRCRRKPSAILP